MSDGSNGTAFLAGLFLGLIFGGVLGVFVGAAIEDSMDLLPWRNRHRRRTRPRKKEPKP